MIFRTGSILIVGMCEEDVLQHVYVYIKNLLVTEFPLIYQSLVISENPPKAKTTKTTVRKRYIIVDTKV